MLAKAEQAKQEAGTAFQSQPVYVMEDEPLNIEDVSHEQMPVQIGNEGEHVFSDLHDYGWETDEDSGQAEINHNEASLADLQNVMCKPTVVRATAVAKVTPPEPARPQVPMSSVPPLPKCRVFALSDHLCEGTLQNELQELYKKMKIDLDANLAGTIAHYYTYTKTKKAINEAARQYTGIKTVPEARVQALNEEVHFVEGSNLLRMPCCGRLRKW